MKGTIAGINGKDSKVIIMTDSGYTYGIANVEYMRLNQVVSGDLRGNGFEILTNLNSGDDFVLEIEAYDCSREAALLLLNEN
ncbi:hypothetical protein LEP1GSC058_2000 [Leptospira fainei serovar Hurstbridge str. BUT 6]|uniref:Uncharacterized protein n=1 Tax=Leptospira fainei serovar Hurstbridge str. BUT 6 TaxID=1193011 RepID=S3W5D8_9LEPT|nr:hypothetical protein [Leptospira fainei]EPG75442.1 hypothetical protein LEP1GSC058_2000 [Leptospira fainei serovar Hurstbridge str. BUT 6]